MRTANFPEAKQRRRLGALRRLVVLPFHDSADAARINDERATLTARVCDEPRIVRSKKRRAGKV